jgi:hypothetical protein
MLKISHRNGDWATIYCTECGDEVEEQWTFLAASLREWAADVKRGHVCEPYDDGLNLDVEDIDEINAELALA